MKIPQRPPSMEEMLEKTDLSEIDLKSHFEAAVKYNSGYLHWDEVRRRAEEGLDPKLIWAIILTIRESGFQRFCIGRLEIKYSMTEQFYEIIHNIDRKMLADIPPGNGLNGKERKIYSASSVMEEAIASSQMEGATTTRQVAKKMLRENRRPRNRSEQMIVNNHDAMRLIKDLRGNDLTPGMILSVHREITKGTLEDPSYEGRFRDTDDIVVSDVITGKVFHKPMPSGEIDAAVRDLCDFVNDEKIFIHPLIKGIIVHYLIGYIHPFADGNGRLARSLFYWFLLKKGYWIVEFLTMSRVIKGHRSKYDLSYLLSETDGDDVTYFIRFNLKMVDEALADFLGYVERKRKEHLEFGHAMSGCTVLPMRQQMMLTDAMRSGEPFSIYEVRSKYQVTYQTARADVMHLEELGLIEKTGKVSNQALYSVKRR